MVIAEIPDDDVMAVDETKTFDLSSVEGESNLRLRLNEKEVNLEE